MKKIFFLTILLFFLSSGLQLNARNLWAFLTYTCFNSPEGPFVETYLSFAGNSLQYKKLDNGKFQASVNVLMIFRQADQIKAYNKYTFLSPEISDTANINLHFIDQQRFSLTNGRYDFEIQLADNNKTAKALPYVQTIEVDFPADKPSISGIELVKSYTKNDSPNILSKSGYDLVPYVFTFYPESDSRMIFYCELYNLDKAIGADQKFLLSYYLETFENNIKLHDFVKIKKETSKSVNVLLSEFNVENLASGNYNLVVEARDQKNELITSRKLFIQRSNPNAKVTLASFLSADIQSTFVEKITDYDSLKEFINSTYPIASGMEKTFIKNTMKLSDLKTLQQFFYSFWEVRGKGSPEITWLAYKHQVKVAQENFGTPIKKGYVTDRGRVFLQYGPPNSREIHNNEPGSYPYEIWQYYSLNNNQRNKRFVFYSQDMVTSDFTLLHSDALGEVYNVRWKMVIRERVHPSGNLDDTQTIDTWGEFQNSSWDLPTSNL